MIVYIAGTEYSPTYKSFEIYVQGCSRHCADCHNPETWEFMKPETQVDAQEFLAQQKVKTDKFDNMIKRVYITGGDILCSPVWAERFSCMARTMWPTKELWLFTGAEQEDIPGWVWKYYDVVKCGPYDKTKRQENLFPASSNQKLIFNGTPVRYIEGPFDELPPIIHPVTVEPVDFRGEVIWKK